MRRRAPANAAAKVVDACIDMSHENLSRHLMSWYVLYGERAMFSRRVFPFTNVFLPPGPAVLSRSPFAPLHLTGEGEP